VTKSSHVTQELICQYKLLIDTWGSFEWTLWKIWHFANSNISCQSFPILEHRQKYLPKSNKKNRIIRLSLFKLIKGKFISKLLRLLMRQKQFRMELDNLLTQLWALLPSGRQTLTIKNVDKEKDGIVDLFYCFAILASSSCQLNDVSGAFHVNFNTENNCKFCLLICNQFR